ncbi:hypothetical protein [Streptomyces sp. ISL-94]|uniref:hypothetical protein n=1 Tax=Streptomyces sp. ISL-94 TaxID=2819190 RepID=UPI001BEAAB60|nr:hypothetical protein [Streptomyces sp. ISL-94]MBT2480977.1 hypothetical protein [Streptomyces sp. ISL-94]
MHAFLHAHTHAARTAELAAEAAAWHRAQQTAAGAPATPALRNRLGEALIGAGIRLMEPAHIHTRLQHPHAA